MNNFPLRMNNFLVALVRNLRVFVSMYKFSNNYAFPQVICEEIVIIRWTICPNAKKRTILVIF